MSKTRDTGFLGNVVKYDANGNVNIVSGSTTLLSVSSSGQLTVPGNEIITGSLTVLGGITGAITGSATSASYAANTSFLNGSGSGEFVPTGSFNAFSSSILTYTGSVNSQLSSLQAQTGSYATTGSNIFVGSQTITGSILGSGSLSINGCIVSTGQIVAQTINVQQVTSSVVYSCGSNIFGCAVTDTQQMTGSLRVTGSLNVVGQACASIISAKQGTTSYSLIVDNCYGLSDQNYVSLEANGTRIGAITRPAGTNDLQVSALYGNLIFGSNTGGNITERARITTSGIACFSNNVCALNLASKCNIRVGIDGGYSIISGPTTGAAISIGANSATFDRNLSLGLISADLGTFSPVLTINAQTGNVGIGNCTPDRRFYVADTSATQSTILGYNQCTTFCGTVIEAITDRTSNSAFNLMNLKSSTTSMFIVKGDGNVGINCSSPSGKLQVANSSTQYALYTTTGNLELYTPEGNCGYVRLGSAYNLNGIYGSCGLNYIVTGTSAHVFRTTDNNTERLRIFSTGETCFACQVCAPRINVQSCMSIGNIATTYARLDINQDGSSTVNSVGVGCPPGLKIYADAGVAPFMVMSQSTRGTMTMGMQAAAAIPANFVLGLDVCGDLAFKNQMTSYCDLSTGTSLLFICRNGNVGIGTTSPNEKLDVNGTIQVRGSSLGYATTQCVGMLDYYLGAARILSFGGNSTTCGGFRFYSAGQNNNGGSDVAIISGGGVACFASNVCIGNDAVIKTDLRLIRSGVSPALVLGNSDQLRFVSETTGNSVALNVQSGGTFHVSGVSSAFTLNSTQGCTTSNGVITYSIGGTMAGTTATYYDFPTWNDGGQGQMFEVKAFFDHFYNWAYGAHYYVYLTTRETFSQALTMFNCTTGNGGSWMAYKPNNTTLRVCKLAGSYVGGGAYWIQVTAKQP